MNTDTATEIASTWLRGHTQETGRLAGRLSALIPEPDAWTIDDQSSLLSLTGRSLFRVTRAARRLTVEGRAIVTDDNDTQITVTDGEPDSRGEWERSWTLRFLKTPADFEDLEFTTQCVIGTHPYPSEALARRIAELAGWEVGDVQPPERPS